MFHRILVAIDNLESSQDVFDQALILAKANQSELMILHVRSPFNDGYLVDTYLGVTPSDFHDHMKKYRDAEQAGIQMLKILEEKAISEGISTEFTQSVGDPGKVICALAKTWNADLIAIGRYCMGGLNEFFIGSVSNYVLHHAHCHVLVLQQSPQITPH
jgi:nucleotide-binding universal stress UspA family protein